MAAGPTIVAKFLADTSQMTGEVDRATSSAGSKMSTFAKNAAVALGGAFVVDKVVEFGKASVEAAAADAEAQAQLAAALKNTTGATDAQVAAAEAYVSNLSKSAAISDDELRPALATLARGLGDTGKAQDALSLATDVAAGTGKDLGAVSEALAKAYNGQLGPLKKLDPALGSLIKEGASADQVMGALGDTFRGQAATAAESTAGQMRKAQIAMGEMQETIGSALLPVIGKLAGFLNDKLFPALTTAFEWLMDHKEVIVAALIGIGAVVLPLFISWAAGAAAAAAATLLAAAPFILIGAAVAALAYLIITNWDSIVAATQAAWQAVQDAIGAVWNWLQTTWQSVSEAVMAPIRAAVDWVVGAWSWVTTAAQTVYDWILNTWSTVTGYITGPIQTAVDWVTTAFTTVRDTISGIVDDITGFFTGVGDAISGAFKTAFNAIAGWWNDTVGGFGFETPSWLGPLGGKSFTIPEMPTLATGGLLTSDGFVFAHAGEVIAPIEKVPGFGGGSMVHIDYAQFNDPVDADLLAARLEFAVSAGLSM